MLYLYEVQVGLPLVLIVSTCCSYPLAALCVGGTHGAVCVS